MNLYVDLGHGGADPGAEYQQVTERDEIRSVVGPVILTAAANGSLAMVPGRGKAALRWNWLSNNAPDGALCLSLHLNAATEAARGAEVILDDNYTERERSIAESLLAAWCHWTGICNRGVKREAETPRKKTPMAYSGRWTGMIFEMAFLTNSKDLSLYRTHGPQSILAAIETVRRSI